MMDLIMISLVILVIVAISLVGMVWFSIKVMPKIIVYIGNNIADAIDEADDKYEERKERKRKERF